MRRFSAPGSEEVVCFNFFSILATAESTCLSLAQPQDAGAWQKSKVEGMCAWLLSSGWLISSPS